MARHYDYHFIGIGGIGMSSLAQVLLESGASVSGSDARSSDITQRLASMGARISVGHDARLVEDVRQVVVSSAIPQTNPELQRARKLELPVMHRGQLLARFVNRGHGIAITGSHGKTTTTAMLATVYLRSGLDPTVFVGGKVEILGSNARAGNGPEVVAEADESDQSFLYLHPFIAVVTNVEDDHLLNYGGERENLVQAFRQFVSQVAAGGRVVLCSDDVTACGLSAAASATLVSYGVDAGPASGAVRHYGADDVFQRRGSIGSTFTLRTTQLASDGYAPPEGFDGLQVELNIPGRHNVQNALAVLAVAAEEGLPPARVKDAIREFRGAGRRFQILGSKDGFTVVDDYAHHPTEVQATVEAARRVGSGRTVVVFQPHLYSRTRQLADEFATSLSRADVCVLLPIYGAREDPVAGVTSALIEKPLRAIKNDGVYLAESADDAVRILAGELSPGDLVLLMGAGDVNTLAPRLLR